MADTTFTYRSVVVSRSTAGGYHTGGRRQGRVGATTTWTATVNGDELVSYSAAGIRFAIDERLDETPAQREHRLAVKAAILASLAR